MNNVSQVNKFSEQEYSNYIDTSDVVIQQYKNSSVSGLEKYFLKIEEWLETPINREENKPYVIEAEGGIGKKALLIKWMEYHQQLKNKKYPDIILSHFASSGGNSSNYFFAIYRLLNKLREALDIDQKVELLEEKLRKYFSYWLNHCSDKLEKQLKQGEVVLYDKIIIIIEAIDQFVESTSNNREANIVFWLPRCFPEKIRVIVTCDKQSNANEYFQRINCKFLKMQLEDNIGNTIIQRHIQKQLFINQELKEKHLTILKNFDEKCKNPQFYKIFLCIYIPYPTENIISQQEIPDGTFEKIFDKMNYDNLMKVQSYQDLINFTLDFFSNVIMQQETFRKLLRVFVLTQKGLTLDELKKITAISVPEWRIFLAFFKVFILKYKYYWQMNNFSLKKIIQNKYKIDTNEVRRLHEEISNVLEKHTSNSIRKLEEQTYHLFMSKNYFKLKETISTIENFLLLFNPNNKYDLCRYWQALEEQGFDPVGEYNKAIEGFEMHYHPSSQDVFRIIVQISRFLKEFADFETYNTPYFRHPPIRGTCEQLEDIGLLRELVNLQLFSSNDKAEIEKANALDKQKKNLKQKIQEKKEALKIYKKGISSKTLKRQDYQEINEKQVNQDKNSTQRKTEKIQIQILSEVESLNVEIPCNREKFRKYFLKLIYETINNSNNKSQEETIDYNQKTITCSDEEEERNNKDKTNALMSQFDIQYAEQNALTMQKLKECFYLRERSPSNYYYKRWLWIQFPWACLSLECDYSAKLKECFSSPIEYMSVKKENEFTKQALKIAIEAKLKKQIMYQKQDIVLQQQQQEISSFFPQIKERKSINIPQNNMSYRTQKSQKSSISLGKSVFMITQQYLNQNNLNKQLEKNFKTIEHISINNNNVNTSSIENMSRLLEKSKVMKDKTVQNFDPLRMVQNSQNISSVLPRIKNEIINHSNKELILLESQAHNMKIELDIISNDNRNLAKKLKQMSILQENQQKYGVNPEKVNFAQAQVMDYEINISKAEEDYLTCLLTISRLKGILKICDNNKQQNEDYIRNLNFLLNNFKKIIRWEQEDIKESLEKINTLQRINKEYQEVFNEKIESQKKLMEQIKQQVRGKEIFDQNFANTDSLIEQSALVQQGKLRQDQQGHDQNKKMKQNMSQIEKNSKIIQEQHDRLLEKYEKLKEVLDISNPNYQSLFQFKKFVADCEKKNEFKSILLSRQNIINNLKQRLQIKQDYLKTVLKANNIAEDKEKDFEEQFSNQDNQNEEENDKKNDVHFKIIDLQNQQETKIRLLHKLQMVRLHSYMVVGTIQKKLAIKQASNVQDTIEFGEDEIIMSLDEKMALIKEKLPIEEFQLFNESKYDFTNIYKVISGNIRINRDNSLLSNNDEEKFTE
ncbi:TPR repeat protein [Ichthyophthirius multifiliis]|uniref:TPR repeat protein n=1 Tax=Ichthyophthirius multifiliis TaxID=5932 RepID=G0R6E6_ICHMU|nr:TPR repeat protein [Ichthyophthirius multifiliis]EGR26947.1 TPR repeat protein [Ichthyophthirius multifiliis]|eukprot:XP_004023831.1 TPR repeat protein [Ichthyophthirius multifiliis]